jgi:LAO/AO transport system kinase
VSLPDEPLARRVVEGDVRALARVCRLVDDRIGGYRTILKQLFPHTGHAWTLGVTGTPGAGKSTLTDRLIAALRAQNQRVAVLAIDPTSPFTGGAILGDRIRMQRHHGDPEVFIRSVATRGALGGLSRSAVDLLRVLDAWRADVVICETVGVGQDELEVTRSVHTTLVVMAPGMGDDVQAIKAGILECADVFAVNKADREGAHATVRDLELMIALGHTTRSVRTATPGVGHVGAHAALATHPSDDDAHWTPPIVKCVATRDEGTAELMTKLEDHKRWLFETEAGSERRFQRLRDSMRAQLRQELLEDAERHMGAAIDEAVRAVAERRLDPYTAAEDLIARFQQS